MAAPHTEEGVAAKKLLARQRALLVRAQCDPALGSVVSAHVLRDACPRDGARIAGFWPLAREIDIRPLLYALAARGCVVSLPVTPKRGQPLDFRRWRPGDTMRTGRFGTAIPEGEPVVPELVLVPLLAFDRRGHRLGYGAGFYDRTLAGLPGVQTLGCAFAAQEVGAVPTGPQDVPLDAVATERGVIICGGTTNGGR